MTLRTHRETLTFTHPFTLSGVEDVQAPGTYTVQTDEELLEGLSFLAYQRVATVIFLPLRHTAGPAHCRRSQSTRANSRTRWRETDYGPVTSPDGRRIIRAQERRS
jgi:hypothetical protein